MWDYEKKRKGGRRKMQLQASKKIPRFIRLERGGEKKRGTSVIAKKKKKKTLPPLLTRGPRRISWDGEGEGGRGSGQKPLLDEGKSAGWHVLVRRRKRGACPLRWR